MFHCASCEIPKQNNVARPFCTIRTIRQGFLEGDCREAMERGRLRIYRNLVVAGSAGNSLHWCREATPPVTKNVRCRRKEEAIFNTPTQPPIEEESLWEF